MDVLTALRDRVEVPFSGRMVATTFTDKVIVPFKKGKLTPMTKVVVHRFQVWDSIYDGLKPSRRLGTVDAIKNTAHGVPVGPPIEIDASDLSAEIEGFTVQDYTTKVP